MYGSESVKTTLEQFNIWLGVRVLFNLNEHLLTSQEDIILNILKPIELNWFNLEQTNYLDLERQGTHIIITIGNNRQIYTR